MIPENDTIVIADEKGYVEECQICGESHRHGSAKPDHDYMNCEALGPGYYYVNGKTRKAHCPGDVYDGDYYLAYGLGEDYEHAQEEREPSDFRSHDTYKQDHWRVLDIGDIDKVYATGMPSDSGSEVRIDMDGLAVPSTTSNLATEGDNVNVSAFIDLAEAEELLDHLQKAVNRAKEESD